MKKTRNGNLPQHLQKDVNVIFFLSFEEVRFVVSDKNSNKTVDYLM